MTGLTKEFEAKLKALVGECAKENKDQLGDWVEEAIYVMVYGAVFSALNLYVSPEDAEKCVQSAVDHAFEKMKERAK